MDEEFEQNIKTASSFPDLKPPNSAIEIGRKRYDNGLTFILYRDAEWNYYYETDRGLAFKYEMEKRRLEKKKKISW